MKILLENVRSFLGRHEVPLADFTILAGENSTGKTTLLAVLAALGRRDRFPERPSFNEPPFNLGNFDTIASRRAENRRSAPSFSIGFSRDVRGGTVTSIATYVGRAGQVELGAFRTSGPRGELRITKDGEQTHGQAIVPRKPRDGTTVTLSFGGTTPRMELERGFPTLFLIFSSASIVAPDDMAGHEANQYLQDISLLWAEGTTALHNVVPLAPIRSKPRRTYEQLDTPFRPEGDHIPIRLARILKGDTSRHERVEFSRALDQFGEESGLFSHVEIKRLAKTPTAAFEIVITIGGQRVNIADVGYGVSQILPVVAETVLADEGTLLLQQPEVHLHPKAQAALGTFLTRLTNRRRIVVETHSDYLIDRVRQEVARKTLASSSVLILFFEPRGADTAIHPIRLDALGNLIDAPTCYRDFFIQEEIRLLSRGTA